MTYGHHNAAVRYVSRSFYHKLFVNSVYIVLTRVGILLSFSTVRPMLSDRCPVCLRATLVYCGQTVGWIKMKLGKDV